MKKKIIRLTEGQLRKVIENVILKEERSWKLPKKVLDKVNNASKEELIKWKNELEYSLHNEFITNPKILVFMDNLLGLIDSKLSPI